jgi:hypothetical protein
MRCRCFDCEIKRMTFGIRAYREYLQFERKIMAQPPKPRNLLRLAGVINAASTEADLEAGELIDRVQRNKTRTLDLITKGHKNETLREQMLAEAEKEHALADLEAAVGDNGGPLLEDDAKIRAALSEAKSARTSKSSEPPVEPLPTSRATDQPQTNAQALPPSPPEVGQEQIHFQS